MGVYYLFLHFSSKYTKYQSINLTMKTSTLLEVSQKISNDLSRARQKSLSFQRGGSVVCVWREDRLDRKEAKEGSTQN
jgi:hypothetical protein